MLRISKSLLSSSGYHSAGDDVQGNSIEFSKKLPRKGDGTMHFAHAVAFWGNEHTSTIVVDLHEAKNGCLSLVTEGFGVKCHHQLFKGMASCLGNWTVLRLFLHATGDGVSCQNALWLSNCLALRCSLCYTYKSTAMHFRQFLEDCCREGVDDWKAVDRQYRLDVRKNWWPVESKKEIAVEKCMHLTFILNHVSRFTSSIPSLSMNSMIFWQVNYGVLERVGLWSRRMGGMWSRTLYAFWILYAHVPYDHIHRCHGHFFLASWSAKASRKIQRGKSSKGMSSFFFYNVVFITIMS